ncbi:MAG: dockerin type I repeat-containing protein [Deltaproteobacteria bacterium]|nr:dockerin type I repeat-containing protein [Deltaproteobacteria bacterium]
MKMIKALLVVSLLALFSLAACSEYSNKVKGDLNGDGHLTQADIELLTGFISQGSDNPDADLNGDGQINQDDLDLLEELVCQVNGGNIDSAGNCCTASSDNLVCCDMNFDGDFEECEPADIDCTTSSDCDELNCLAYCSEAGKCRCEDPCADDEDCYMLNCPAFCNNNGECECKIPCDDDIDCGFISKCPSRCGDENYCVCIEDCVGEGEGFEGEPTGDECCQGLTAIVYAEYFEGQCLFVDCLCFVCTFCGDNQCGPGENPCNCAQDCGECSPGDTRLYSCQNVNQEVPWCTCAADGTWDCIRSPENQCYTTCRTAGEHFQDFEGTEFCCEGLTKADDCVPSVHNNVPGCACVDCPCFVCVECGDNFCGAGENYCTCPDDCPVPECNPGAKLPCGCVNNLETDPPCWECDQQGNWIEIDYTADPCHCAHSAGCAEGFVCERESGQCLIDCRLVNCSDDENCIICGAGELCHPDTGLCVIDCRLECDPEEECGNVCADNETCDLDTGLCVPSCLGEGGRFEDFDTSGKCCEGLVAIPDHFPENGGCVAPNCPCFVCTKCGTDEGVCSLDENRCNCPQDCVGAGNCQAEECIMVAGDYVVAGGDCPGIGSDFNMYAVTQTGDCSAMEAELAGGMCDTGWGYKWDGSECVYLGGRCECLGEDCHNLFQSQQDCRQAYGHCFPGDSCDPMSAELGDIPCDTFWGYKWDGNQCVYLGGGCPCEGADCDKLYQSEEACRLTHAHCNTESCQLGFGGLIGELLGQEGCIDHNIIFTSRGCSGAVIIFGVSRTMHFTCPFPNADQTQPTCSVFLDDMID